MNHLNYAGNLAMAARYFGYAVRECRHSDAYFWSIHFEFWRLALVKGWRPVVGA